MGYRRFDAQFRRNYKAGTKIADDLTKLLFWGGAYAATKVSQSLNDKTSYTSSTYKYKKTQIQATSYKEPIFKIDLSILSALESPTITALKKNYNDAVRAYEHIDSQIKDFIQQRNQIVNRIDKISWIKWFFKKRILRLEAELQEVQNRISSLTSKQVIAKVNTSQLAVHPNFEAIKIEGEKLLDSGTFVVAKYDNIPLDKVHNHREWYYTTYIGKGSVPQFLGKSDHYLNLCGGDFTLSLTPYGIVFISGKSFYIFEYSKIQISYRLIEMREPDPKFSKSKHKIVSYVWEHSTLSGAPDKRYRDNRQLPVVEYGNIVITIDTFEFNILHPDKVVCSNIVNLINCDKNRKNAQNITHIDGNESGKMVEGEHQIETDILKLLGIQL